MLGRETDPIRKSQKGVHIEGKYSAQLCESATVPPSADFERRFAALNSYGRTLDYYRLMFREGPYKQTEGSGRELPEVELIDQINYAAELYPDVLPLNELLESFPMEPGYGAVDGSVELGPLIRRLELARAARCANAIQEARGVYVPAVHTAAVGLGCGVTGALTIAVGAILQAVPREAPNIISVSPNYCIIEEVARLYGCSLRSYRCDRAQSFLPDLEALSAMCDDSTAAICLTHPTNPSHNVWTLSHADGLQAFIAWCQERDVFVIFDMIFQDLTLANNPVLEPFALAGSNRSIVKLFGPSKDRPFAGGHRIGYFIADPRLSEPAQHLSHIMLNSPPFYSKLWLAFDLFFRHSFLTGNAPTPQDCAVFDETFIFGEHYRDVRGDTIADILSQRGLFERYKRAVVTTYQAIRTTMSLVHAFLSRCPCFETLPLPIYGNSLFVRVRSEFFDGTDHDFFLYVLRRTNVGLLVGNAFGLRYPSTDIWFRVVCVAERPDVLIERLSRIVRLLKSQ